MARDLSSPRHLPSSCPVACTCTLLRCLLPGSCASLSCVAVVNATGVCNRLRKAASGLVRVASCIGSLFSSGLGPATRDDVSRLSAPVASPGPLRRGGAAVSVSGRFMAARNVLTAR